MRYAEEKCVHSVILSRCTIKHIPSKKPNVTLYRSEHEPKEHICKLQLVLNN